MTDDWSEVEFGFARLDQLGAWRPLVAAMRRLIAAIRADTRFHDLAPSFSHSSLVFRRQAERCVWVSWFDDGTYEIAFVARPSEVRDRVRVAEDRVLEVLLDYVEHAPP